MNASSLRIAQKRERTLQRLREVEKQLKKKEVEDEMLLSYDEEADMDQV